MVGTPLASTGEREPEVKASRRGITGIPEDLSTFARSCEEDRRACTTVEESALTGSTRVKFLTHAMGIEMWHVQ
ncbi:hypothetical protein AMTR_s00084p00177870 [Amborella trichopoda]|uniref:Uncharacterized protein n=1 Tax=Amborella trichopoda TaxID=13333 RepID=W1P5T5_AMBTC|nr:hypothetical protein AMTR_s00084p00177870 [Amborella trichopoda]